MSDLIVIDNGQALLDAETASLIAEFERKAKEIKEASDKLKAKILEAMEDKGIVKLDTPDFTISYIAPTDRETFDSKALKADNPDLYDSYVKMTPVKSSVRIRLK